MPDRGGRGKPEGGEHSRRPPHEVRGTEDDAGGPGLGG